MKDNLIFQKSYDFSLKIINILTKIVKTGVLNEK